MKKAERSFGFFAGIAFRPKRLYPVNLFKITYILNPVKKQGARNAPLIRGIGTPDPELLVSSRPPIYNLIVEMIKRLKFDRTVSIVPNASREMPFKSARWQSEKEV